MPNILSRIGIEKFDVSAIMLETEKHLLDHAKTSLVIYACDARTLLMYYQRNGYLYDSYNKADFILPDGRPIYWLLKRSLGITAKHLTGPSFMRLVLHSPRLKKRRHMFYGGTSETIQLLTKKCQANGVNLVYSESPPFLSIDHLEVSKVSQLIQQYEVDFLWCGLGAPKQEYFIQQLNIKSNVVLVGVGLAFDYYAGAVKTAPKIISNLGLEWAFRYSQQPKRIKRFIKPFFFVLGLLIREYLFQPTCRKR